MSIHFPNESVGFPFLDDLRVIQEMLPAVEGVFEDLSRVFSETNLLEDHPYKRRKWEVLPLKEELDLLEEIITVMRRDSEWREMVEAYDTLAVERNFPLRDPCVLEKWARSLGYDPKEKDRNGYHPLWTSREKQALWDIAEDSARGRRRLSSRVWDKILFNYNKWAMSHCQPCRTLQAIRVVWYKYQYDLWNR